MPTVNRNSEGSYNKKSDNRISIREINAATVEIAEELRRHLENQIVFNVEDFRGKNVTFKITLKRVN